MAHDGNQAQSERGKGRAIASVRLRKSRVATRLAVVERDRGVARATETSARTGEPARDGVHELIVDFLASFADARAR